MRINKLSMLNMEKVLKELESSLQNTLLKFAKIDWQNSIHSQVLLK